MLKKTFVIVLAGIIAFTCSCKKAQNGTEEVQPNENIIEKEAEPVETNTKKVKLSTSVGDIIIELNADKAPITVENFLGYVNDGFYSGLIFHRVIKGFMIQGGGITENLQKKATKAPIKNEASNGLSNLRGTISMARMDPPDSATSQFFINHVDNKGLDYYAGRQAGYAVFGKVIDGMDVVDKIASVQTTTRSGFRDIPVQTITINSAEVIE